MYGTQQLKVICFLVLVSLMLGIKSLVEGLGVLRGIGFRLSLRRTVTGSQSGCGLHLGLTLRIRLRLEVG